MQMFRSTYLILTHLGLEVMATRDRPHQVVTQADMQHTSQPSKGWDERSREHMVMSYKNYYCKEDRRTQWNGKNFVVFNHGNSTANITWSTGSLLDKGLVTTRHECVWWTHSDNTMETDRTSKDPLVRDIREPPECECIIQIDGMNLHISVVLCCFTITHAYALYRLLSVCIHIWSYR